MDTQLLCSVLLSAKALFQPQEINLLNSNVKAKYTSCILESLLSHIPEKQYILLHDFRRTY